MRLHNGRNHFDNLSFSNVVFAVICHLLVSCVYPEGLLWCVHSNGDKRKLIARNASVTSLDHNWIVGQKSDVSNIKRRCDGRVMASLLTREMHCLS